MKVQTTVNMEKSLFSRIQLLVESGRFRNKSHAIEWYVIQGMESEKKVKK